MGLSAPDHFFSEAGHVWGDIDRDVRARRHARVYPRRALRMRAMAPIRIPSSKGVNDTLVDTGQQPIGGLPSTPGAGKVSLAQSRWRREGMFGALIAVFTVALVRGLTGGSSGTAKTVIVLIIGVVLVCLFVAWVRALLHPARLEITEQCVHYAGGQVGSRPDLMKGQGPDLRVYWRRAGRTSVLLIEQTATGLHWSLPYFSQRAVADACRSCGWQVPDQRPRPG
jgi:hypothetical protein